jgi:hypothetical protein
MARHRIQSILAIAGMSAFADASYGQFCVLSNSGDNTACGTGVLTSLAGADYNTGIGYEALDSDTTGVENTAVGAYALWVNRNGAYNTATGFESLTQNTSGSSNTADGYGALWGNRNGIGNVAIGWYAMNNNYNNSAGTSSSYNVAVGTGALANNTTNMSDGKNTAVGYQALYDNAGTGNNAQGYQALFQNTTGSNNSAIGQGALYSNTTGVGNNAVGLTALENMTTGERNTAVGNNAGLNLLSGNYNTYIGWGVNGVEGVDVAAENYVTRIGVTYTDPLISGTPTTYISGIYNVPLSGQMVVVTSTGQLGVASASSERFKTDIAPMPEESAKLSQLRPVTFRYRTDAGGTTQYGLIAEQVAKVYPELVIRDGNGRIDGVRYDELAPILLGEVQRQAAEIHDLKQQAARVNALEQRLDAVLRQLEVSGDRVAQR